MDFAEKMVIVEAGTLARQDPPTVPLNNQETKQICRVECT